VRATVDSAAFTDAVTRTIQAVSTQPAHPVMAGLLLQVRRGHLHVTGADYLTVGHVQLKVISHRAGRVLVDAARLAAIARNLPTDTATLATRKSTLVITSGRATWTLLTMPDEDYPTWTDSVLAEHGNHADRVRPQGPSARERQLSRAERKIRDGATPWKPRRTRTLYEPAPFAVGDWVAVTTDTGTNVGQMAADDVVIWLNSDGTTWAEQICRHHGRRYQRWYVRRQDKDAATDNPDDGLGWKTWDLRRASCPFEPEDAQELDERSAAPATAEPDPSPTVFELPDPFDWQWPEFDPADLAVAE
jgi:hypothetical protein